MLQRPTVKPTVHVMVATPSAATGQGGVDRVMATLKAQLAREDRPEVRAQFVASRGAGSVLLSPFYTLFLCLRMIAARLRGRVDVVHINLASDGSTYRKLVIANCARLMTIPYVLHLHGAEYQEFWEGAGGLLSRSIENMFERAAQVVVLGSVWREFIAGRAPGVADKITIIANATGVPALAQRGGGESVHILFLGRIGERKGVPQLLAALSAMAEDDRWRATVAGDGSVDAARNQAASLGLSQRVAFPGWVGPTEVAQLIASADILVLPSFAENLPVSVIEGMAAGLAVVATPVGAVTDIIVDEKTGLLVPPGDVGALAMALGRLVSDAELRAELGKNARMFHRQQLDLAPFAQAICEVWIAAARTKIAGEK